MLAKAKIKQSFASAAQTYDDVAALQRQVGRDLWRQLGALQTDGVLLDVGCGTGFMLTELINQEQMLPNLSIALDIAEPMLQISRRRLMEQASIRYLCADAERLPLLETSVDVVISNLALQWCRHLETVFADIHRILKPGGVFGFTIFGAQTLQELKQAWREVDNYQHVNRFFDDQAINDCLVQMGIKPENIQVVSHSINYPSVLTLMTELKRLGARIVMEGGNPKVTGKGTMQRMIQAYEPQMPDGSITATFEVISIKAKRIH
ncbi:MAG: malonyl-ACP O-methyltransferase BioC [Gammaproteobacteria bacterium]|nr:malonyl-ACP O-methyltransferase BioC [Gammaproteobacteria bacterium]